MPKLHFLPAKPPGLATPGAQQGQCVYAGGALSLLTRSLPSTPSEIFAKVSKQRQNSTRSSAITLGSAQAGQEPGPGEKRACCLSL